MSYARTCKQTNRQTNNHTKITALYIYIDRKHLFWKDEKYFAELLILYFCATDFIFSKES